MYAGYHEEGDRCPECREGKIGFHPKDCSCHITAPCHACVDCVLSCPACGWEDEPRKEDEHTYKHGGGGIAVREYRPRKLDNTKISWRSKMHTHFTMIKEGVYPDGTTIEEVRGKVNGTFGGRFTQFGGGRFKFVAYTD